VVSSNINKITIKYRYDALSDVFLNKLCATVRNTRKKVKSFEFWRDSGYNKLSRKNYFDRIYRIDKIHFPLSG